MSTTAVTSTDYWKTATTTATSSSSGTDSISDFDTWLELLATELQYQDPTDPVSSTEYVSQMAQMSSLLQMENIYTSVEASQAYSMLGKTATYEVTDSTTGETTTGTGIVTSVITSNGNVYLNIDGTKVDLDAIVSVSDDTETASA